MIEKSICPVCFNLFPIALARSKYPTCGDCGSEAIDVDVIPLDKYLTDTPLKRLVKIRSDWAKVTGFYETYKKDKLERIDAVIQMKKQKKQK